MEKIFEIITAPLNLQNTSFEEFRNIFSEERNKIEKFLNENFENPEKITYLDYKIDYGKIGKPYGQSLYMNKGDEQYEKAFNLLKQSENFNKAIGYKIYIKDSHSNENNPKQLSGLAFGYVEFLFDEELTKEFKEADRKLHEDVAKFYVDSRTNHTGD